MADINLEVTKDEINNGVKKANSINGTASEINEVLASVSDKQDALISGTNIKTINNQSILGGGNISIEGGSGSVDVDGTSITKDSANKIQAVGVVDTNSSETLKYWSGTKAEYNAIASKDSNTIYNIIDDTSEGTEKQDKLISGTNIKTINNQSILGEGNITIEGSSGGGTSSTTYLPPLLQPSWFDHLVEDMSWLRADTFSWHDGNTYKTVYNKLVEEYATGTEESGDWSQPILTSNGTVGGSSYACECSSIENGSTEDTFFPYHAFDNNNSTRWGSSSADLPDWITFYSPVPLYVSNVYLNFYASSEIYSDGYISGSNDNSNWTIMGSFSSNSNLDINVATTNNKAYKYIRFTATAKVGLSLGWGKVSKMNITATTEPVIHKRTSNGFKIAPSTQEEAILNKYNTDGIAWYYILDTTNKRFKLPRTKFGFEGLRDKVGKDVAESLPNIKGRMGTDVGNYVRLWGDNTQGAIYASDYSSSNSYDTASGSAQNKPHYINFDASRSYSTYQDNAPVQERATQMYLYFYVGEYSKTAVEQTAGLNSELFNGKADSDLSNLSSGGRRYASALSMPSSKYTDLTLGASGATYIAPSNGWYVIKKLSGGTNQGIRIENTTSGQVQMGGFTSISGISIALSIPCRKDDNIAIYYSVSGSTDLFRFVYAEGSRT